VPALVAVACGVLLGYGCGGSLSRLGCLRLRFEWLILPLFVIQAAARGRLLGLVGASQISILAWTLASSALVVAMLLNYETPGMLLGAAGVLMNLDVVLMNAAMPVVLGAKVGTAEGVSALDPARDTGGFYRLASQGDLLVWLGDSVPVTLGRTVLLVSPGDVVLMVAVAVVIVHGMTRRNTSSVLASGI
jgi:hypothetical protein